MMEHIELICSSEFELTFMSICSIRSPSKNRDISKTNFYPSRNKGFDFRCRERLREIKEIIRGSG